MNNDSRIVGFANPDFDSEKAFSEKIGTDVVKNPYNLFKEMRQQAPVHAGDFRTPFGLPPDSTLIHMPHWTVLSFQAVQQVLGDQANFLNAIYENNLGKGFGRSISTMDPPEHTKYRRLFQKAFTPVAIAKWGDHVVAPVVQRFIDRFIDAGKADLVSEFTIHYPFHFIYGQLDLPTEDVSVFHSLAIALTCISNYPNEGMEASRKLGDYFRILVNERRDSPGDDLISLLGNAEIDGEKLPDEVIVSFLRQLMNAGGDTTYRGSSNLLVGLLTNPDQLTAIRNDRSLIPQAIEEGLRWEAPVVSVQRSAARDVEIAGIKVPEGAALDVVIGAANRDESAFEDPDQFNIFRKPQRRHSSFGFGPHVCIGQHLARLEVTVALNALLDRLPNLRLDPDYPAPQVQGLALRSPPSIPVLFD